jgi:hypothetical protein
MAEVLRPRPLGLDRLSPRGISLLREFVEFNGTTGLSEAFDEELRSMPERDVENARTKFEALANSEDSEDRLALCFILPGLATKYPDLGFPLWCRLMRDPDTEVWDAASQALADSLGVLELDPERVIEVVDAHFEGQRAQN